MGLNYPNLDERTRKLMEAEIERDIAATLYLSGNLSEAGKAEYPNLLRDAARSGTDGTFAAAIRVRLNSHEKPRQLKSGKLSEPSVMRSNAHEMLGEGQFNRFYMRALCLRATEDGIPELVVFRAKSVENPRPESERMIGRRLPVGPLLESLRKNPGDKTAIELPAPNSGLSVRLP
jgi:hypothetical protein